MDHSSQLTSPDPGYLRTRNAYHHLVYTMNGSLPPPVPDTPQAQARRNSAAIAQIAALCPANAAEAALAAQYVAANAHAMDSLRLTHDPATPMPLAVKCNAQAASMMRQSQGALKTLLLLQAARHRRDANGAAANTDAWTEHSAAQFMTEILTETVPQDTRSPQQTPTPMPPPAAPLAPDPATAETVAAADAYAHLYPHRAAMIRRLGRVPDNVSFGPPDEDLVRALVTGQSATLIALDGRDPRSRHRPVLKPRTQSQ